MGGMGVVYLAQHLQLGRPAALKMLLPQVSSDAGIVQRFFNEARAASAIDHPGIVEIYDFGTHTDGRAYIVMALLKGEALEQRLARSGMDPMEGAAIVAQVAGALAAAHARGIVHRDLKPDNIFLVPNELMPGGTQVKLLDFGIAKLVDDRSAGVKTQTGMLIGTPAYMSPEQCMGRSDLDHRTDLYSLGCILFHILCGRPPFTSEHGTGVMLAAHMRDAPPDPRTLNPRVPLALVAIVLRLLEKDPAARYQTANELRNALAAVGDPGPVARAPAVEPFAPTVAWSEAQPVVPSARSGGAGLTTRSGAAAQLFIPTQAPVHAPRRKKLAVWLGVGVVLAGLAGVGVLGVLRSDAPAASAPATVAEVECTRGQVHGGDTQGHCCWPEQAWSVAKERCVGLPSCPAGMIGEGEQCIRERPLAPVPAAPPSGAAPPAPAPGSAAAAPTFQLTASSYAPGASIQLKFAQEISSPGSSRAWITVCAAGSDEWVHDAWKYVDDHATEAVIDAPKKPGAYEVRLHTDYPAKTYHLVHAERFTVTGTP